MEKYLGNSLFDFFKWFTAVENRRRQKSVRLKIDPVRSGSNRFQRFRLLDNQNISSTSHVPANLFPIMSHLHESFKAQHRLFIFSDSNNRLLNAYLKCSNKKALKIYIFSIACKLQRIAGRQVVGVLIVYKLYCLYIRSRVNIEIPNNNFRTMNTNQCDISEDCTIGSIKMCWLKNCWLSKIVYHDSWSMKWLL